MALHLNMATNGVPYLMRDDGLFIAPAQAGNVILEFVE